MFYLRRKTTLFKIKINFLPFIGYQHFLTIKCLLSLTICCISGAILYPICGKCQTHDAEEFKISRAFYCHLCGIFASSPG